MQDCKANTHLARTRQGCFKSHNTYATRCAFSNQSGGTRFLALLGIREDFLFDILGAL